MRSSRAVEACRLEDTCADIESVVQRGGQPLPPPSSFAAARAERVVHAAAGPYDDERGSAAGTSPQRAATSFWVHVLAGALRCTAASVLGAIVLLPVLHDAASTPMAARPETAESAPRPAAAAHAPRLLTATLAARLVATTRAARFAAPGSSALAAISNRSVPPQRAARPALEAAQAGSVPDSSAATRSWQPEPAQPPEAPGFLGRPEREIMSKLATEPVLAVSKGRGGRTLAFKLTLASGIQGYFKPEQSVSSAHWYAELAAYHLDRALGIGRVPPVVGRALPWRRLAPAAGNDRRVPEITVRRNGLVRGALVFWLSEPLVPARTPPGWENWIRVKPFPRVEVSPYQRAAAYGHALNRAHARRLEGLPPITHYATVPNAAGPDLPAALSDMIVFDFLTLNYDRFGGHNANILTLGPAGPLIFLDNGDGFSPGPPRRSVLDERLAPLQRFHKRTIDALRAFDLRAFAARLASEALAPVLSRNALHDLEVRRRAVLEHVGALERRFGDAVYTF